MVDLSRVQQEAGIPDPKNPLYSAKICDVCFTSSWDPCPKETPEAVEDGREGWMVCGYCKMEKELRDAKEVIISLRKEIVVLLDLYDVQGVQIYQIKNFCQTILDNLRNYEAMFENQAQNEGLPYNSFFQDEIKLLQLIQKYE